MSFGALGLLMSTAPTELAAQTMGWRLLFIVLAAVTLAVALTILALVPEQKAEPAGESLAQQVRQLVGIYKDRAFLAIAPLLATTAGTHIAIQTLWAGPWFRDVAGFDRLGVANHLFAMGVAFLVGILGSGVIADWFARRGFSELAVMTGFLALFVIAQLGIVLEMTSYILVCWLIFSRCIRPSFTYLSQLWKDERPAQTRVEGLSRRSKTRSFSMICCTRVRESLRIFSQRYLSRRQPA